MPSVRMVPLATSKSQIEARVLAARLGAEGILWQFRALNGSVLPLGDIDVLVTEDDLERASEMLLIDELEAVLGPGEPTGTDEARGTHGAADLVFIGVLALMAGGFLLLRLLV